MKADHPQFKLRLPPHLKEQLEGAAAANERTITSEIVARLEEVASTSTSLQLQTRQIAVQSRLLEIESMFSSVFAMNVLGFGDAILGAIAPNADDARTQILDAMAQASDYLLREKSESELSGNLKNVTLDELRAWRNKTAHLATTELSSVDGLTSAHARPDASDA